MELRYKAIVRVLFRLTDAGIVVAAWLLSYWARFFLPSVVTAKDLPPFSTYASLAPLLVVLWVLVFSYSHVYESGRMRSRRAEVLLIWRAHFTAVLIFVALAYTYDAYKYSRLVMVYFATISAVALAVFRVALRTMLRSMRRRGYDIRTVLIVGDGHAARAILERILTYPELGMRLLGLLTQDGAPSVNRVLGSYDDIDSVIETMRPDHVVIALPPQQQYETPLLLRRIANSATNVRIVPDLHQYSTFACSIDSFDGMPVIGLNDSPIDDVAIVAKRGLDLCLAAIGLLLGAPLLLLIAVLVKLNSPGPIFFSQERMGLDGRTFRMWKFRSMRVDAETEKTGAVWTTRGDDRRTPLGKFLRATSLDELPQLWNVFLGQMSMVGPRPERPVFIKQFRQTIPAYMLRHKVKAGITGWAQVNGWRGDTSIEERTACDLYYIRNWSIALDIKILTMTIWKGFVNKNAY